MTPLLKNGSRAPESLRVVVSDNQQNFDTTRNSGTTIGLLGIRESSEFHLFPISSTY